MQIVFALIKLLVVIAVMASSFVWEMEGANPERDNPADLNRDGQVDLRDFLILKSNVGGTNSRKKSRTCQDGDANGDGRVNDLDYLIWEENFGMAIGATCEQGDFDGDGDVGIVDYSIVLTNWDMGFLRGELNGDCIVDVWDLDILRAEMGLSFTVPSELPLGSLSLEISSDGAASLTNSGNVAIAFDSISIFSKTSSLSLDGWQSIESKSLDDAAGVTAALGEKALGFQEGRSTESLLNEVILTGEASLPTSGAFSIGRPYQGLLADASSDLQLFYTEAGVVKEGQIKIQFTITNLERHSDGIVTIHWIGADHGVEVQSKLTLQELEWRTISDLVTGTSWSFQSEDNSQFFRIVIP